MKIVQEGDREIVAPRPLRLLHVSPSFAPAWSYGGPIESSYQLCRHLAGAGCKVEVLTTEADGIDQVLDVNKYSPVEMALGLTVRYCRRVFRHSVSPTLLRLLVPGIRSADVVHLHAVYSFPTVPTLLICRLLNKPLVWSPRGSLQRFAGRRRAGVKLLWEWMCRRLVPANVVLHVTSEAEARESAGRLGHKHTVLIPNGVAVPDLPANAPRQASDRLRILFLGRLDPKKGIENLLIACRTLRDTVALHLTVAGAGNPDYEQALRSLVEKLGLSSTVIFTGELRGQQKDDAFFDADVLVMPSFSENFGNVVAEALAHAVPVVASKHSPWAEVESVGCGLWVDNAPDSLADAIKEISRMPLRQMGERGREWMLAEYSWREVALRMRGVYVALAERQLGSILASSLETGGVTMEV